MDTPCLCRPSTRSLPSGAFLGVWPFWGGGFGPPCFGEGFGPPCFCRPAASSQPSWCVGRGLAFLGEGFGPPCFLGGPLRPSLFAQQLSRGFLLSFPRHSGVCFCFNLVMVLFGRSKYYRPKIRDSAECRFGGVFKLIYQYARIVAAVATPNIY